MDDNNDKNMQAFSSLPWKYVPVKFTIITLRLDLPNSQSKIVKEIFLK